MTNNFISKLIPRLTQATTLYVTIPAHPNAPLDLIHTQPPRGRNNPPQPPAPAQPLLNRDIEHQHIPLPLKCATLVALASCPLCYYLFPHDVFPNTLSPPAHFIVQLINASFFTAIITPSFLPNPEHCIQTALGNVFAFIIYSAGVLQTYMTLNYFMLAYYNETLLPLIAQSLIPFLSYQETTCTLQHSPNNNFATYSCLFDPNKLPLLERLPYSLITNALPLIFAALACQVIKKLSLNYVFTTTPKSMFEPHPHDT